MIFRCSPSAHVMLSVSELPSINIAPQEFPAPSARSLPVVDTPPPPVAKHASVVQYLVDILRASYGPSYWLHEWHDRPYILFIYSHTHTDMYIYLVTFMYHVSIMTQRGGRMQHGGTNLGYKRKRLAWGAAQECLVLHLLPSQFIQFLICSIRPSLVQKNLCTPPRSL